MNAKQDDRQGLPLAVVLLSIHLYFIEVCYFPRVAKLLNRQQDRIRGLCARHIDCNSPLRQVRPGVGIGSERWLFRDKGMDYAILSIAALRLPRKIGLREVPHETRKTTTNIETIIQTHLRDLFTGGCAPGN